MEYPRQLITSLVELTDKRLVDFFKLESGKDYFSCDDFNLILGQTLWLYIENETEKYEIKKINNAQSRMRKQKKSRWAEAFKNNLKNYPITNRRHPFFTIKRYHNELSGKDFIKLFNHSDMDEVEKDFMEKIEQWEKDENELLINYPLIYSKSNKQIVSSFQIDLIINLLENILSSYDGNVNSYFSKKPDVLLSAPIFTANKYSIPFKETINNYVAELFSSDAENFIIRAMVNEADNPLKDEQFKVFDSKDNQIILTLINNIKPDFYESKTMLIEVGVLARAISMNSKPSKWIYDDVKRRTHRMARISFDFSRKTNPDESVFTFNFLGEVLTKKQDDKEYLIVTFGNILYDAIMQKKMIPVTSTNYNALDLDLSKLVYHNLQKERIILSFSSIPDENGFLYKSYDYSFFMRIVLFKNKRKSNNVILIKEMLDEFVNKKIAISHYNYESSQNRFHLYYFQLTPDEKEDFQKEDHFSIDSLIDSADLFLIENKT